MRRTLNVFLALAMTMGGIVAIAAPAMADHPTCTRYGMVWTDVNKLVYYEFAADASPVCELKPGDHGLMVLKLQKILNLCYGPRGLATRLFSPELIEDESYGSLTAGAVRAVQRHLGLRDDGWAGPNTRSRMAHNTAEIPQGCLKPKLPLDVRWVA